MKYNVEKLLHNTNDIKKRHDNSQYKLKTGIFYIVECAILNFR